jgi:hypothetical protein
VSRNASSNTVIRRSEVVKSNEAARCANTVRPLTDPSEAPEQEG